MAGLEGVYIPLKKHPLCCSKRKDGEEVSTLTRGMHFDNFTNKRSHPPLYPPCTTWQLQKYTSKNSPDTGTALKDSQTLLCVYFKEPCKPQKVDSA